MPGRLYSFSTDGGRTWPPNVKVTDRMIDRSLRTHSGNYGLKGSLGLASTDQGAFIAWDDSRNSVGDTQAQDIYFGRVRFQAQAAAVFSTSAPAKENKLLWSLLGAAIALSIAGLALLAAPRLRSGGHGDG